MHHHVLLTLSINSCHNLFLAHNDRAVFVNTGALSGYFPYIDKANVFFYKSDGTKIRTETSTNPGYGLNVYPISLARNASHNFFVTNFTSSTDVWKLVVPLSKESLWTDMRKFPCQQSMITPDEPGNCDLQIRGQQTIKGDPLTVLGPDDEETPACCPEGLIPWFNSDADTCCVDTLTANPYRLNYQGMADGGTVFEMVIKYAGVQPSFLPPNPEAINCTANDVDQIIVYIDRAAVPYVWRATVNDVNVTVVPEEDEVRGWVRLLNLHYIAHGPAVVKLFFTRPFAVDQLCDTKPSHSPSCEYVIRGNYDNAWNGVDDWQCCPIGATAVQAAMCPTV